MAALLFEESSMRRAMEATSPLFTFEFNQECNANFYTSASFGKRNEKEIQTNTNDSLSSSIIKSKTRLISFYFYKGCVPKFTSSTESP